MAIPLPQPTYFQPFTALTNGMMTEQQITRNALANQYQQMQNQFYPKMQNANLQYLNSETTGQNLSNQYAPQRYQAQINQENSQTNWTNVQANNYLAYLQAMNGRNMAYYLKAGRDANGNPGTINTLTGQFFPANSGVSPVSGTSMTQMPQQQPQPTATIPTTQGTSPNAMFNQYGGNIPMPANNLGLTTLPAPVQTDTSQNAMNTQYGQTTSPVSGYSTNPPFSTPAISVDPTTKGADRGVRIQTANGVQVTPTTANISQSEAGLSRQAEADQLIQKYVQLAGNNNSPFSWFGLEGDAIGSYLGNKNAMNSLTNYLAAQKIAQQAAGAQAAATVRGTPTQGEIEENMETLFPNNHHVWGVPANVQNSATLKANQALGNATQVSAAPIFNNYSQPSSNATTNVPKLTINSPQVIAAAKKYNMTPQQVVQYANDRGLGG